MGAWIEIIFLHAACCGVSVAPLVGAWIEIKTLHPACLLHWVAPLVGAWIEINVIVKSLIIGMGRSSRGSVD